MPNRIFWINMRKKVYNIISEHHHRILHIRNSLGIKFKLKLTILDFWTRLTQKGYFLSKKVKNKNYYRILHIRINLSTEFQLKLTILIFWTKFVPKGNFLSKREKVNTTMDFSIFELFLPPNFSINWQFWVFRYK